MLLQLISTIPTKTIQRISLMKFLPSLNKVVGVLWGNLMSIHCHRQRIILWVSWYKTYCKISRAMDHRGWLLKIHYWRSTKSVVALPLGFYRSCNPQQPCSFDSIPYHGSRWVAQVFWTRESRSLQPSQPNYLQLPSPRYRCGLQWSCWHRLPRPQPLMWLCFSHGGLLRRQPPTFTLGTPCNILPSDIIWPQPSTLRHI